MVKFASTNTWLLGLLAIAGRSGTVVSATNNIVQGAFIVEFEDGFVSKLYQKSRQPSLHALACRMSIFRYSR